MSPPVFRAGIRGKILAVYGLGFAMILTISAGVQFLARQAGTEFETRLHQYYAVQSLRMALGEARRLGGLAFGGPTPQASPDLEAALNNLLARSADLEPLEPGPGEAAFRAVGARRGLEAYAARLRGAAGGAPDLAYRGYLAADRVASFADQYLAQLLSAVLEDGTRWYRSSSARTETWGRIALAANAAALAAAAFLAFLLAGSISRPIRRLAEASRKMAAGDLDVEPVAARTGDEVEVLAGSFTTMSRNLREMVGGLQEKARLEAQVHRDELALVELDRDLKEARYYALQSRIRPHFLFNALNTLSRTALLEGAAQTEELTRRLAALMRYSLGTGQPNVTLGEELGIVTEYLQFQAVRFGARLTWEVSADPGASEVRVPRFTLQPLVENAVMHGIEPRVAGGRVTVAVRRSAGRVRLAVLDTGAGMAPEARDRVRAAMRAPAGTDLGVGTASLEARLGYLYGAGVRTALYTRPGRGTFLTILLPLEEVSDAP